MTVTLTLTLGPHEADMLRVNTMRSFYAEQADRFEVFGRFDLPLPNDPVFEGGVMHWCETASDALLLRAYEEACGHTVTLLADLAGDDASYVVLSSQSFDEYVEHL